MAKLLENESIYSYIVEIKVLPISYDTRFVYFIIFQIKNLWYLLLWSTSGLKLTISFISRLIKITIKWIFKHIANYCSFILVSKEDRQRIYNSKIGFIRLPKSLEEDTKRFSFRPVIILQSLKKYDMLLKSSHLCHLPLITYLVAWCLDTIATPPNTTQRALGTRKIVETTYIFLVFYRLRDKQVWLPQRQI